MEAYYKNYVSKLRSENTKVKVIECKSLSDFKIENVSEVKGKSVQIIVNGIYTIGTVNNVPDLSIPYIPTIKKLSQNMKRSIAFEKFAARIEKLSLGISMNKPDKVILLIGGTGVGKTTKSKFIYGS